MKCLMNGAYASTLHAHHCIYMMQMPQFCFVEPDIAVAVGVPVGVGVPLLIVITVAVICLVWYGKKKG